MLTRLFCRIYAALLYAYPREFRVQYGGEMKQLFRDRCRDRQGWLRFALHSAVDWLTTVFRETMDVRRRQAPRGFVAEWAVTIVIYLFATTTLVQAYVVPTGSMEGNLRIGDHMLVDRVDKDARRGDIVAFLYPEDIRQTYVKRVIGVPGDRIHLVNKDVIRNGRRLIEPYTRHIDWSLDSYRDDFPTPPDFHTTFRGRDMLDHHVANGEVIVPPDALFVMGDNRDNSEDSRYWGFVPREYVVGKPLVVYWSYDAPTSDLQEWTLDHVFDVAQHFFTKTRWDRSLLVPRPQAAHEVEP